MRAATGRERRTPRLRRGLAAAGVLVLMALAPATAAAKHLTETGSEGGAPSVPWGFNEDWGWSAAGWSVELATQHVEQAGAIMPDPLSANRFHVQWAHVEAERGRYDWTIPDLLYDSMRASSVEPVMLLYNAPPWARDPAASCPAPNPCAYPPLADYDAEWKAFVQAAAARYPEVRAIEVWNEPNLGRFWAPAADPERYAALLAAAHEAVVAAGVSAPVLSGGLVPAGSKGTSMGAAEFLRQLYTSGCACDFEGIAAHPYPRTAPLVDTMWKRLEALWAARDEQGDDAPLWITEIGVSTDETTTGGVSSEAQGEELIRLYRSIEDHDIRSFVIHRLHDIAGEGSYWNQTGIVGEELTAKPAYCALGAAIGDPCQSALVAAAPPEATDAPGDTEPAAPITAIEPVSSEPSGASGPAFEPTTELPSGSPAPAEPAVSEPEPSPAPAEPAVSEPEPSAPAAPTYSDPQPPALADLTASVTTITAAPSSPSGDRDQAKPGCKLSAERGRGRPRGGERSRPSRSPTRGSSRGAGRGERARPRPGGCRRPPGG